MGLVGVFWEEGGGGYGKIDAKGMGVVPATDYTKGVKVRTRKYNVLLYVAAKRLMGAVSEVVPYESEELREKACLR